MEIEYVIEKNIINSDWLQWLSQWLSFYYNCTKLYRIDLLNYDIFVEEMEMHIYHH